MTMTHKEAANKIRNTMDPYTNIVAEMIGNEAYLKAIQSLERLDRLEELLVEATKEAGQHHDHFQACQEWAFGAVLDFIRTGEEWS